MLAMIAMTTPPMISRPTETPSKRSFQDSVAFAFPLTAHASTSPLTLFVPFTVYRSPPTHPQHSPSHRSDLRAADHPPLPHAVPVAPAGPRRGSRPDHRHTAFPTPHPGACAT